MQLMEGADGLESTRPAEHCTSSGAQACPQQHAHPACAVPVLWVVSRTTREGLQGWEAAYKVSRPPPPPPVAAAKHSARAAATRRVGRAASRQRGMRQRRPPSLQHRRWPQLPGRACIAALQAEAQRPETLEMQLAVRAAVRAEAELGSEPVLWSRCGRRLLRRHPELSKTRVAWTVTYRQTWICA